MHTRRLASAGALFPIETYVIVNRVADLDAGLYPYEALDGVLHLLREGDLGRQAAQRPDHSQRSISDGVRTHERMRISQIKAFLQSRIFLVLVSSCVSLLAVEGACRVLEIDFEKKQKVLDAFPIYYRRPSVPTGEVFFRRPGPATWQGQVIYSGLKNMSSVYWPSVAPEDELFIDELLGDESKVTITYDKLGFRNPADLDDWDIVIVGDSYTELGHLPYEDLFTTRVGSGLGSRVKNLGVSHTGTLTHVHYLKEYGMSPSTKHAVVVFFEGNDIKDMLAEQEDLVGFRWTGQRKNLNVEKQTSFLKAIYRLARKVVTRADAPGDARAESGENEENKILPRRAFHNAYFQSKNGELAVSAWDMPPSRDKLNPNSIGLLDRTSAEWSEIARAEGIRPWLVYMPTKRRVLHGHLRFTEDALPRTVGWQPSAYLPELVKGLCEKNMIDYIDATPSLVRETRLGNLTYNPIYDNHLNRHGSHVVAQVIADALGSSEE